ncbi:ensconsin-like [Quercus lobata]|uniref:ensconsin-like n=1 Tax=Quercus lobata TaxID=97700 RepID=UPI0012472803|nr:ensconsin-like [Quercus lobata]
MGLKRKPQTSLFDLIEDQPGKEAPGKSQSKPPPPPPQPQPIQIRSTPARSRTPSPQPKHPASPQLTLPPQPEPTDSKRKRSSKGKEPMDKGKSHTPQEEGEAPRTQKQLEIGPQGQGKEIDAQSAPKAWLPALMLHGEPLTEDASLRNFRGGEGAYVADALERPLLLPTDMKELKSMRRQEVFLSMKRSLETERNKRLDAALTLKNSEDDLAKAREDLKEMTRQRDSAEAGLSGAQTQAEAQTKRLLEAEDQLGIAKKQIIDLKKRLTEADQAKNVAEWARDEALRAKTEAETSKDKVEEEAYDSGVADTQAILKAQIPGVCRLYCSQVWNEALKQVGVEASFDLWKAKKIYYPLAIRETNPETVRAPKETEVARIVSTIGEPAKGSKLPKVTDASGSFNPEAPEDPPLLVQPLQSISPADVTRGPEANPAQLPMEGDASQGPETNLVQLSKEGTKTKSKK